MQPSVSCCLVIHEAKQDPLYPPFRFRCFSVWVLWWLCLTKYVITAQESTTIQNLRKTSWSSSPPSSRPWSYLGLELKRLPDEFDLLAAVVLLHDGEAQRELRHLQSPSPGTRRLFENLSKYSKFFWGEVDNTPLDLGRLQGRGCGAQILLPAIKPNCLQRRNLREEQMERFTKMSAGGESKNSVLFWLKKCGY